MVPLPPVPSPRLQGTRTTTVATATARTTGSTGRDPAGATTARACRCTAGTADRIDPDRQPAAVPRCLVDRQRLRRRPVTHQCRRAAVVLGALGGARGVGAPRSDPHPGGRAREERAAPARGQAARPAGPRAPARAGRGGVPPGAAAARNDDTRRLGGPARRGCAGGPRRGDGGGATARDGVGVRPRRAGAARPGASGRRSR